MMGNHSTARFTAPLHLPLEQFIPQRSDLHTLALYHKKSCTKTITGASSRVLFLGGAGHTVMCASARMLKVGN